MSSEASPDHVEVVKQKTKVKQNVREPVRFKVIYINDEVTTTEFVVETLKTIFDYDEQPALALTQKIHADGTAVVAVLPFEMAEQKGVEVTVLARNHGFPLQVKIEPDN
jgi:ATP-dependent Clp protease adaptor protein ClpS|tara:strand:- start:219 stop:545 length:327 start_codon:yes stop_codon:yes gene_type:complete